MAKREGDQLLLHQVNAVSVKIVLEDRGTVQMALYKQVLYHFQQLPSDMAVAVPNFQHIGLHHQQAIIVYEKNHQKYFI